MFRFTIRELVLLTVVVATGVGWWIDRSSLARQVEQSEGRLFWETIRADDAEYRLEHGPDSLPYSNHAMYYPES